MKRSHFLALSAISFVIIITSVSAATGPPTSGGDQEATAGNVIALILYIILALLFSFLCSIAEAVLLNITPSYIADLREKQPEFADRVKQVRQTEVDESLAAILTMNTIAHTVGAIGSGAEATIVFGSVWFGVFSAVMTLAILFLSEIVPKTIGVVYWRSLARFVVSYIRILRISLYPIIWISEAITRIITRDENPHVFSRDEFIAMAGVGEESGQIDTGELKIIRNLFRLSDMKTREIYTPRTVMMAFEKKMTVSEVLEAEENIPFSRLPIYNKTLDDVTGFILTDELLFLKAHDKGTTKIEEISREMPIISIHTKLSKLLEFFLSENHQIALVIDEFATKGVVTFEDVLETLLGEEIVDETDNIHDMRAFAKKIWQDKIDSYEQSFDEDNTNSSDQS